MLPKRRNKRKGFTLIELLVAIAIVVIMVGVGVAMLGPFGRRQQLEISTVTLIGDLRQTHQFSRVLRDDYKYYGLRFYGSLGEDSDRDGYKIVRYEPPAGVDPIDMDPSAGDLDLNRYRVIKSSDESDNNGAGPEEFLENTFFGKGVTIAGTSDLGIGDSIVFTPEGSATYDGVRDHLLPDDMDDIILSGYGNTESIHITPLTGHIGIE